MDDNVVTGVSEHAIKEDNDDYPGPNVENE